jgi:hypothetical protein
MTKLEFGDFYKFLVSLGSVLVALSMLLPWLFLRESFNALVGVSDISELTPSAQALVSHQQRSALWFVRNAPWISGGFAIVGVALLTLGLVLWWRKQTILDQRDRLETQKLRREVESLTPAQIAEKVMDEAEEEARLEEEGEGEEAQLEPVGEPERVARYRSVVEDYFRIERTVLDKLVICFGQQSVLTHKRVRRTEYDAIVLSADGEHDVVVEIKATKSRYRQMTLHRGLDRLILAAQNYQSVVGRPVRGVLLLVLLDGVPEAAQPDIYGQTVREEAEAHGVELEVHLIADKDLARITCRDLRSIVRGGSHLVV